MVTRTTVTINSSTLEALNELKWEYRARSLHQVIDILISEAAPEIYHEYIDEDEPEA